VNEHDHLPESQRALAMHIDKRIAALGHHLEHELEEAVRQILAGINPQRPAVGIRATIGGSMDITLDVDVTGETVSAQFVDDKGDVTPTGPNGPDGTPATIGYASSDPTVATVDASGALSFLKAGTATITATANDSTGTPVAGFATGTANITLTPGAATGLEVSVNSAPPVPAPSGSRRR
jgi:hypothetical protein